MDAVEFLEEWKRMCDSQKGNCFNCPLDELGDTACRMAVLKNSEKAVEIVQKWAEENPVKTRMIDFFEKFPKAMKRKSGVPLVCANHMGYCSDRDCGEKETCCTECWNRPLEEE